ncbi:MAG: fatty acid--CoA ligase [Sphingomonadales bacterium]|nr:fatty acid--CoA ligase [Sphingomonadales bacterium]
MSQIQASPPPLLSFDHFITHWATDRPERLALREDDRTLTFSELEERTAKVASALIAAGLRKGDRIAWLGKNSDLYYQLFFGAARIGVVMVPVGWRLAPAEIAYIVNDTQARLLFVGPGFDAAVDAIRGDLKHVERILGADAARRWIDASPRGPFSAADAEDAVLQLYTSGTTGNPKGAVLSNRNLFGLRIPSLEADLPWSHWDDDEVVLMCMPCAHIGGTGLGVMALAAGVAGHIMAEFEPGGVLEAVATGGVTRFFMVPAALQMVINHPDAATTDFTRLKYIIYGAAPIPLELLRECIKVFGAQFLQAYGMTETTGTVVMLPPEDHDPNGNPRMRAAGKPLPGVELKIVDEAGNEVPTGEVGEIITRSSNNMISYWNLPEATAKTMSADGWVRTGDAGYMDEDGYLFIHDRVKDMIISGGENVYPAEVESAIYGHPAIAEVAVIGIPDDKWGEAVKAVCVPKPGAEIDEADVIAWARERIAGFKVPKSIDVIAALPRNASGKILRKDLRAPYWEGRERQVN